MRWFLLRLTPFFIFVLFTSIPFSKVVATSYLVDEYGRIIAVGADGAVLGEEFSGLMPGSGDGGQPSGDNRPQQQDTQPQQMMQQQIQQFQGRPSMMGKPAGSSAEMQKKAQEMMRIGVQNGELRVQTLQERAENEFKPPEKDVDSIRVRESAEKREVEIQASGNELEIKQQNIRARTRFPLSVNDKNELIVTTPNGTKTVTVLPEEAVKEAMRRGVMTSFGAVGQTGGTGSGSAGQGQTGSAATDEQEVELTQENGKLEYKVNGVKEAKLFGFFPVSSQVETRISAETGAVTSVSQPWYFSNFGFLFR